MTYKLKTETFSQKIEHSGGVIVLPLTTLFSFVSFHLKYFLAEKNALLSTNILQLVGALT